MEVPIDARVAAVRATFSRIHREVFAGDPAANEALEVEVIEAARVGPWTTMAVIAPWTITGVVFSEGEAELPTTVALGGRPLPILENEVEGLGRYGSVTLVPDLASLSSQEAARAATRPRARALRDALERILDLEAVEDPSRRSLFRGRA